jgi:hypothetical protein
LASFRLSDPVITRTFAEWDSPAFCHALDGGWNLTQLAALAVLAEAREENATDLFAYIARVGEVPLELEPIATIGRRVPGVISAYSSETQQLAVGMESLGQARNFAILLENSLAYWYQIGFSAVVPMYGVAYRFFLSNICRSGSELMVSMILGPSRQSVWGLQRASATAITVLDLAQTAATFRRLAAADGPAVVVGHGANGLLAKSLGFSGEPWCVTFEAPMLDESPMIALTKTVNSGGTRDFSAIGTHNVNLFTDGSIYSRSDKLSSWNVPLPEHGGFPLSPPDPLRTFCLIEAACERDDRFALLCGSVLGGTDAFWELEEKLDRQPWAA